MAEVLSQESDISFESANSDSIDSEEEQFVDAIEPGTWTEVNQNMVFNQFDESQSGPQHTLPPTATVLDFFALFWDIQLINLIVLETKRLVYTA